MSSIPSPSSRFRSNPSTPAAAGAPVVTSTRESLPSADATVARFEQLQQRRIALAEQRMQLDVEQRAAQREMDACLAEAQAFGVTTLEELEALIAREQHQNEVELNEFEVALNAEERLLGDIGLALKNAGA